MQEIEKGPVSLECVDHSLHRCRIVEVATGGGFRQQQVVAHHRRQRRDVGRPESQAISDRGGQFGTDDAVVSPSPLPDVVDQRTEHEQIRPSDASGESACIRGGFDQVPIHRPRMDGVARRKIANGPPLRQESTPEPGPVHRLDHRNRTRSRTQHDQEIVDCIFRPRLTQFRGVVGQAIERRRGDGHAVGGRRCRDPHHQTGILLRPRIARQDNFPGMLDDALVQWPPHRRATQPRQTTPGQGVSGGTDTDVDRIADGARRFAEKSRQIEAITDP